MKEKRTGARAGGGDGRARRGGTVPLRPHPHLRPQQRRHGYDESLFYDAETNSLTPLFYKSDRSIRGSGFDLSNRFGPLNAGIIHHAPIGLNGFLYRYEKDLSVRHHGDAGPVRCGETVRPAGGPPLGQVRGPGKQRIPGARSHPGEVRPRAAGVGRVRRHPVRLQRERHRLRVDQRRGFTPFGERSTLELSSVQRFSILG